MLIFFVGLLMQDWVFRLAEAPTVFSRLPSLMAADKPCLHCKLPKFYTPPLETLKFLLVIESEDAGFLEGSLQFAEAAELLLAAAGC